MRAGFDAAALLAPHASEHARQLVTLAEAAKQDALLQTAKAAGAYIGTILLALLTFKGLLRRHLSDDNDLRRIGELINRIPSDGERARVWAELALRAHAAGDTALCQRLVGEHVRPLLQKLRIESPVYAPTVVATVSPALYCAYPVSAREEMAALREHLRDLAYYLTCRYLFRRHTAFEPFEEAPLQNYDISYERALEICELIGSIGRDDIAYYLIRDLVNSLADSRHRDRFTRDQTTALASKLSVLATSKFPNPKYITHPGYLICVKSLVERLRRSSASTWDSLAGEARALPNYSDRVFVLCTIAEGCQPRDRQRSNQLLQEAYTLAQALPCGYDRVARTNMIAKQAWQVDTAFAKRLFEAGMKAAIHGAVEDLWQLQKDMLDFAYRVDPDLAAKLVSIADTDVARVRTRLRLRNHLEVLKTTKGLADKPVSQDHEGVEKEHYPRAAWRLLGQLNAGRLEHRKQEDMREYVQFAATLPFSEAYPILSWVIANAVFRFSDTDQAGTILRPVFEATLLASQIAARMADENSRVLRDSFVATQAEGGESRGLIRAGERDLAISRLRQWIEEKVEGYLVICDPFFGTEDLTALKLVLAAKPNTRVRVLTGLKHQVQEQITQPYSASYIDYWRSRVSDQEPPDTEITIVGAKSSLSSPIHDRWWLTAGAGLRMGTSFRSLGVGRDSELSELSAEMASSFERQVNRYLNREVREHDGERLSYSSFTLD